MYTTRGMHVIIVNLEEMGFRRKLSVKPRIERSSIENSNVLLWSSEEIFLFSYTARYHVKCSKKVWRSRSQINKGYDQFSSDKVKTMRNYEIFFQYKKIYETFDKLGHSH